MSRTGRESLTALLRAPVALAVALSLAVVGCATGARDRVEDDARTHAGCDAERERLAARHAEELAAARHEVDVATDGAELGQRELARIQGEVQATRERSQALEQALDAALARIGEKEQELADARARAGSESELEGAAALLRRQTLQIAALQEELARARNPDLAARPIDEGGVSLAGLDLEMAVATVDGRPLSRRDLVEFLYRDLATPHLLELFINRHLILGEARRRGIDVSDVDVAVWVEEQLIDHVRQAGSSEAFDRKLAEAGFDKAAWSSRLRYQALPMLLMRRLAIDERTTPGGRDAFEARIREEYQEAYGERLTAGHIFVRVLPDASAVEQDAALQKARAAMEQVRRGIPFADVARRLSEDEQTQALGGTLGTFGRDRFARTPDFNAAIFTLEPGRVSDPIRSPIGYHVVLVEKRAAASRPFDDEVRQELAGRLSREPPTDVETEALIARLRHRAQITRTLVFEDPAPGTARRPR